MALFKGKYRTDTIRLKNWDYGWNAAYFVTINTKDRKHYFGEIENGAMQLSAIGKMADRYWQEIPRHYPFIKLDEFVIMPDHMHGIVIIDKKAQARLIAPPTDKPQPILKNDRGGITGNKNPILHDNLSRIIRWYKGRVSFESRKNHPGFAWQSRFHESIVRGTKGLNRIKQYIINNPAKWQNDNMKPKPKKS